VKLRVTNGVMVDGKVRMIAPTVDPLTRNALVYVDLPVPGNAHAGMSGTGQFLLGHAEALTLPQSSVVMRDGFSYVYQLGKDDKVIQTKVTLGRRVGERIEVASGADGITPAMILIEKGAGFLADGDTVRVASPAEAKPTAKPATASGASLALK
jgi:multidrug efflux pump subunit AcrA (membrane-fusion protein)